MNNNNRLQQILDIGIALTKEKDANKLLNLILNTAMELTASDAGTLYILKDNCLEFRIMKTLSKGFDRGAAGEKIDIPPVELKRENICAYAAITKQSLNIEDVYTSELFDFSGPKKYDEINNYRTQSMVAIPMIGEADEVIGVMQLINAMDEEGSIRSFTDEETRILMSLASQTALSISNMDHLEEISKQMWSFTEAMTEAIDARTPYNASHTRKVAEYSGLLVDHINELHAQGREERFFDKSHKDQIILAALLHDIGKMIVPIRVMNKKTRLDSYLGKIEERLEKIDLKIQINGLKGILSEEEYNTWRGRVKEAVDTVHAINEAGFLTDEMLEKASKVSEYIFEDAESGETIPFFTEEEKECLKIRKGTLTSGEREVMESHVVMTKRILDKVYFNRAYKNAPLWAGQHHECINGKGYPEGISGDELGVEARILAVADICDALLATDRPYKKPLPMDKAFAIMEDMAKCGQIDEILVGYMKECIFN